MAGITAKSVKTNDEIDLSEFVSTPSSKGKKSMLVLGTYAADFNAIEYAQRLRYYMVCIVNVSAHVCVKILTNLHLLFKTLGASNRMWYSDYI